MKTDNHYLKIDWDYFRNIPIDEVATVLNIRVRNNIFLCPSHNDTHPSTHINLKRNTWRCYVCNEGGSTLDLVAAVEGVTIREAAIFLEQYFPGGIKKMDPQITLLQPPYLDPILMEEIGLKTNPFQPKNIRAEIGISEDGKAKKIQDSIRLQYEEATELVIGKLLEYIQDWKEYTKNILLNFPKLNQESVSYIKDVGNHQTEKAEAALEVFRDFYAALEVYNQNTLQNAMEEIETSINAAKDEETKER